MSVPSRFTPAQYTRLAHLYAVESCGRDSPPRVSRSPRESGNSRASRCRSNSPRAPPRSADSQRTRPVAPNPLRPKPPAHHRGRANPLEHALDTVIADKGGENLGNPRVEPFRIVCKRRDVLVAPDPAPPLVFVHRAE